MTTTFAHEMPFGAQLRPDGTVRFRLWAPAQQRVRLWLAEGGEQAMERQDDGWFELETGAAGPGSRYAFVLDDGMRVPDPASRSQPEDVHAPSQVVDPGQYVWQHPEWRGRPWPEVVLYELHTGTFSDEGTFDGARGKLDRLVDLGITALELMPVSDFSGQRNWGYDGVLPFAPDSAYGTPENLKRLIDEAHGRGLMVFLDVVYNHFGPDGNYLNSYAPQFFDPTIQTPWGEAIDYGRPQVRDFVINNVLYWLQEYRFDGLRFDAVDRIHDRSDVHILSEIAETVRRTASNERHVHLVLENDANEAHRLERLDDGRARLYDAQWNDDIHHVFQHLLTGEAGGYYADYAQHAHQRLARALSSGFVYQGEASGYRDGAVRGEPSGHLPPTAFVGFIQNHDQIGNRAFGERIADLAEHKHVQAMQAVLLLAPHIPLLFMGEEWGAVQPFCFFTDFHDELADAVREGRRREFKKFPEFASEEARAHIPDPNAPGTFEASRLDWTLPERDPDHAAWLEHVKHLLHVRAERIMPLLAGMHGRSAEASSWANTALAVRWRCADGRVLALIANLGDRPAEAPVDLTGEVLFATSPKLEEASGPEGLPPWSVLWLLRAAA